MEPLQGVEHGAVVLRQQAIRYVQAIIRIDADQMRVERRVMDFGQRDAIGHDGLAEPLVLVGDDVGGIEKKRLGQSRRCATTIVGGDDGQPPPLKGTDIKRELPNPNFRGFPLRQ
jgi:hypothetical protein